MEKLAAVAPGAVRLVRLQETRGRQSSIVAFERALGDHDSDAGLLYLDTAASAWTLLQYNSTLLRAPEPRARVLEARRETDVSVCSFNIRYGTAGRCTHPCVASE